MLDFVEAQLTDARFDEFKVGKPRSDGTPKWVHHWAGKTVRALADASINPHRSAQYKLLYPMLSEHGHGAPGSYFDELTLAHSSNWTKLATATADRQILELGMLQSMLYVELWKLLDEVPQPTGRANAARIRVGIASQEAFTHLGPPGSAAMLDEIRDRAT